VPRRDYKVVPRRDYKVVPRRDIVLLCRIKKRADVLRNGIFTNFAGVLRCGRRARGVGSERLRRGVFIPLYGLGKAWACVVQDH